MPFLIFFILFFSGCSGPSSAPVDNEATDADALTDTVEYPDDDYRSPATIPAPPAPPAPVDWGECPAGWDAAADIAPRYCLPRIAADCPVGMMPRIGASDCVPVGETYTAPDGATVVEIAVGGEVQAVIDDAPDGSVIRFAAGEFTTPIALNERTLMLVGATGEGTTLAGGIAVEGGVVELVGLTVRNDAGWAITATAGTELDIQRMLISGGAAGGLRGRDATIKIRDSAIVGAAHYGLRIGEPDTADSGSFTAERLLVRGIVSDETVDRGKGMECHGATVSLRETVVEDVRYGGISVVGSFDADLLIVRAVSPSPHSGDFGYGVVFIDDFTARLSRTVVSGVHTFGVAALGSDDGATVATLDIADTLIEEVRTQSAPDFPATGLDVEGYATVTARRVAVRDGDNVGLLVMGPLFDGEALIDAEDISVERIAPDPYTGQAGVGIALLNGVDAALRRTLVAGARQFGVQVSAYEEYAGYLTRCRFEDLTVRDTLPAADGSAGIGIGIYPFSAVELRRTLVQRSRTAGVLLYGAETGEVTIDAAITDLTVRDTAGQQIDGEHGYGIVAQFGVALAAERIESARNRGYGLLLFELAQKATLADLTVTGTLPRDCYTDGECPFAPGVPMGHGVGLYGGAAATVERAELSGNAHGIDMAGATLIADPCDAPYCLAFIGNSVAVNGHDLPDGYDPLTALGACYFRDNEAQFSGDAAPIPEPVRPGE